MQEQLSAPAPRGTTWYLTELESGLDSGFAERVHDLAQNAG